MAKVFASATKYSPRLNSTLQRLDALVDWERSARVRGAQRLMRVDAGPARNLVSRLGIDVTSFNAVHVTGSKGKGTVSALIAAGLGTNNTGVLASPHVERVNERIQLRGSPVNDDTLADALDRVMDARAELPVLDDATWFDVITTTGIYLFARDRVPYAVLEAGMGARKDSTAVVDAKVAVVTNVFNEHADIIGPTREDIAYEKAGAIRPGGTLVLGMSREDPVAHVFRRECESLNPPASVIYVPPPQSGGIRARNIALAREALHAIGGPLLSDSVADAALAKLPARMERFVVHHHGREVQVLLDGAHVAESVADVLAEYNANGSVVLLGVGADKDCEAIARVVLDAGAHTVFASQVGKQCVYLAAEEVANNLRAVGFEKDKVHINSNPVDALNEAVEYAARRDANLVIVGSLHLAGAVRPALQVLASLDQSKLSKHGAKLMRE